MAYGVKERTSTPAYNPPPTSNTPAIGTKAVDLDPLKLPILSIASPDPQMNIVDKEINRLNSVI
jgi:hypothetical protein